ncbi:MAG: PEP-CTERM sorting domain-containing protein [Planctomycetales bacterium]|nr:PEP-CTERM sorting domain-containing protein [Planctomycetales bacterium]
MDRVIKKSLIACVPATLIALVIFAAPSARAATLVDYYQFEGNGTDSAGGDANGAVGGSVTFGAGPIGQAGVFTINNTTAERIEVPQANAFNPGSGDFSYAFWVNRDTGDVGNPDVIFDGLNGTGVGYQTLFDSSGNIILRLDTSTDFQLFTSASALTDTTEFHHVAVTVDRTGGEVTFYFDGIGETPIPITSVTGSLTPDQDLWIGGGLDGQLDDLRFYTGVLTAGEVASLVFQASVPEPSTLLLLSLGAIGLASRRGVRHRAIQRRAN